MGQIGKISPIKKQYDTANGALKSIGSSLRDYDMNMFPGTSKTIVPYKERNGEYRTGLDANALYIKKMSEADAKIEIARVTALRKELEDLSNLDLSSRSDYYTKMWANDGTTVASMVKLYDKDNIYNLDDLHQAITYAWLRVHPDIAPSFGAWEKGMSSYRCPDIAQCQFFVNDEKFEAEAEYEQNLAISQATSLWVTMNPMRRYKVAKLLNLPVSHANTEAMIFNEGTNYINAAKTSTKTALNVTNFLKIATMKDDNLEIRFKVIEGFDYNVYRKGKNGVIYEIATNERVADNEQELVEYFCVPKNQDEYLALLKKIETAKAVEV